MTFRIFFAFALRHHKLLIAGALALVFAALALYSPTQAHYPVVRIWGDGLRTTLLMRPAANQAQCQASLSNIT